MAYTHSQVMMTLAAITYAPAEDIPSYLAGESLSGVPSPASDFFAEALDQHDHNYYLKLLGAPTVPITAPGGSAKKKRHSV